MDFRSLQLNRREPVYQQIAAYIRRQIFTGAAQPGDPLPSRREIAAQLGINPNTVQKAFRQMEEEGYVVTNGNAGSVLFVDDTIRAHIEDELTRKLLLDFIRRARGNRLSLPRVITLLGELWDTADLPEPAYDPHHTDSEDSGGRKPNRIR